MTEYVFIADLAARGIRLTAKGNKLGVISDSGAKLTKHDRLFIDHWRPKLLAALNATPEEFAVMSAAVIFDAMPGDDDSARLIANYNALSDGTVRCDFCNAERNVELPKCWRCFPSVFDELFGPAPKLPANTIEQMVENILGLTDTERAELRAEMENPPDDHPVHPFEQVALRRAEEVVAARKDGSGGEAA